MKNSIAVLLLALLASFGLPACDAPTPTQKQELIPEADIMAFGQELQEALYDAPILAFQGRLQMDLLSERMVNRGLSRKMLPTVRSQQSSIEQNWGKDIAIGLNPAMGYYYRPLNAYHDEEGNHLIMALYVEGGINYHNFLLVRDQGKIKIADGFFFSVGEDYSTTMARLLKSPPRNYRDPKYKALQRFIEIDDLMAYGDYEEAYKLLWSVSDQLADQRIWHLKHVEIAAFKSEGAYDGAVNAFLTRFEGDIAAVIQGIDYYYGKNNLEKLEDCVALMQAYLGGNGEPIDPLLEQFVADVMLSLDDYEGAKSRLQQINKAFPDFDEGYYSLAYVYGLQQQWPQVAEIMRQAFEKRGIIITDFGLDYYPDFRFTQEYKRLKKEQEHIQRGGEVDSVSDERPLKKSPK